MRPAAAESVNLASAEVEGRDRYSHRTIERTYWADRDNSICAEDVGYILNKN
jgi:hypothetical protein